MLAPGLQPPEPVLAWLYVPMFDPPRFVRRREDAENSRLTTGFAIVPNMEVLSLPGHGHPETRECGARLRRERQANRGRRSGIEERPSLRLPTPFDDAMGDEAPRPPEREEKVERGVVVVDFYI